MAQQLCIPTIGTVFTLTEAWTFRLYDEYRNEVLLQALGVIAEEDYIYERPVWEAAREKMSFKEYKNRFGYHNARIGPERDGRLVGPPDVLHRYAWYNQTHPSTEVEVEFQKRVGTTPEPSKRWVYADGSQRVWNAPEREEGTEVTLPAGTTLKVDRIYIRKGVGDYDSLTFFATHIPGVTDVKRGPFAKRKPRFWAKLGDVNRIICEIDPSTVKL